LIEQQRVDQDAISRSNSEFWNTLCGSILAKHLGVTDRSRGSLAKFDRWFFTIYPYLSHHIPFGQMRGRRVLEVGLGYGTVSQRIAESGALYTGVDIAEGPVEMANHRLALNELAGQVVVGSILAAPFKDACFDFIVAIGCYHHTGDMQRAIDESHRLLAPGGSLIVMVYNGLSYRQWYADWRVTLSRVLGTDRHEVTAAERARYDKSEHGAAPHTDFPTRRQLRQMCRNFSEFKSRLENVDQEPPFNKWTREQLINTPIPRLCGLDIYATATKGRQ
jgi:SAM-dependent methyltransferase